MRPTLNIIDDILIAQILDESKRVMSEIGMQICGTALRQRLLDHGLKMDKENQRVLFPAEIVDKAIATAPKTFSLFNRDAELHVELGANHIHFVPGSSGLNLLDHRTGQTRPANSTDFVEYARLCDGLENISYLATAFSTNADIEPQVSDAWRMYLCFISSRKPMVSGAFTEHGVDRMVEMMQLFRDDRADLIKHPMSIFTITPSGKFRYSDESCQNLLDCVEAGIPIEIVPVTLMGMIAPVTLVGALVFHCVDVLTGITMAQIIKPGAPVLFGGAPATFHMQTTTAPMTAIEAMHLDVAYAAVAKYLELPSQAYMALSDSKFLDAQSGAETFGSALLAGLAGINSISGPGMLDYLLTFSLAKLVFDNELCGQVKHFIRELKPVDDLPTMELVKQVIKEGQLITAEQTLGHWTNELYLPDPVIDRTDREVWVNSGSTELPDRVKREVDRRLADYTPIETDTGVDAELRRIISAGLDKQDSLPVVLH
jgi:trimethylamine--corrinoid protein Co-methyltransferase